MTNFSDQDKQELKKRLDNLQAFCFPPADLIRPKLTFLFQKDFGPGTVLGRGSCFYPVEPSEIKNIWEDKRTLRDSNLDYIMVQKKKWFFNTQEKVGQFFLEDGSRMVEIEFPYWMDMSNVIKTPGVRTAVFNVLSQCMGQKFPKSKTAQACFSKKLCQEIYNRNPSGESLGIALLEILEVLRTKTKDLLNANHSMDIADSISFKRYQNSRSFPKNTPPFQKVVEYLDGNYKRIYTWGEHFGIMKNAQRVFRYEVIRDHFRHPDRIPEHKLHPEQIYNDFCLALGEPNTSASRGKKSVIFGHNAEITRQLGLLGRIWDVLDYHVNPKLQRKKNEECYYTDLVQKGLLESEEVPFLRAARLYCNAVAHVGNFVTDARSEVINKIELDNLSYTVYDRHSRIIKQWLADHDRE